MEEKKGWSWFGFLFMPYYYAGYGALQKGVIFAILLGIIAAVNSANIVILAIAFFVAIGIAIYGGINAKKELPVGKQDFSWKNVIIVVVVYTLSMFVSSILSLVLSVGTPKCNDEETKNLVIQIAKDELSKQGLSQRISKLNFNVVVTKPTWYPPLIN
jgi:hypothetical protein